MGRLVRFQGPEAIFHINICGARGGPIFCDDGDRIAFLHILEAVLEKHGWTCLMYCLMTTHYHLLVFVPEGDLSAGMHRLNWRYARTFNANHAGSGHVFDDRYYSTFVQSDAHLHSVVTYVALNPVRGGICRDAEDWPWSSYAALVDVAPAPELVDVEWVRSFYDDDRTRAIRKIRNAVAERRERDAEEAAARRAYGVTTNLAPSPLA